MQKVEKNRNIKKSPALAVLINLIPGRNQVGAMEERSGFPVLSGHAHAFPGIAPFNFFSRGTSFIDHAQDRGLCSYLFYMSIIYQNQAKMARIKLDAVVLRFHETYANTTYYTLSSHTSNIENSRLKSEFSCTR
jgi:hypothetical protein